MFKESDVVMMITLTSTMMLILFGFFIYVIIRNQKNAKATQLEYFDAIFETQEKEQSRIARDLHDHLGPTLSVIKMQIDSIDEDKFNEEDKNLKKELLNQMENAVGDLRSIAHNLIPKTFDEYGLVKSIEYYVLRIKEYNAIKINFDLPHENHVELNRNFEITIFRMIQELFHNTIKHANATQIDLTLKISDKLLYLNYIDNGIGLKQSTESKPGIGMTNLKSRTDFLGGTLEINHEAKQGFEITFSFKLKEMHGRK